MRILVTGGTGFAGSHLLDLLIQGSDEIFALVHSESSNQQLRYGDRITAVSGDMLDRASLQKVVQLAQPDLIYHLAGQPYPGKSWKNPARTVAINTGGTANLLETAVSFGNPRVVVVTSAEIYGRVSELEMPLTEETSPRPRHPYGISKWAAAEFVRLYWERYELPVFEARPFNHIGPRQALGFVVPDFASQIAMRKLSKSHEPLRVGNLDARRDFTDVRDVVRAYQMIGERGQPGEAYLICSGDPVPISYLLHKLIDLAEIDVSIATDPNRMRPSDVPLLYGSPQKLEEDTGWQPEIPLEQSLTDVLDEWLAHGVETSVN